MVLPKSVAEIIFMKQSYHYMKHIYISCRPCYNIGKQRGTVIPIPQNGKECMAMRSKQAATMSDVAREAGVALGTVSKVINGQPVGRKLPPEGGSRRQKAGLPGQRQRQGAEEQAAAALLP